MTGHDGKTMRRPTPEDIRKYAHRHYMHLDDEEIDAYRELIIGQFEAFGRIADLQTDNFGPDDPPVDRVQGSAPDAETDPYNAFVTTCRVSGRADGLLSGYTIGVKDNISVAGIEMTCGSRVFEGYLPQRDATAVSRVLDAGGTIVGKLNMTDMAVSGSGELTATGPVLNPRDPDYLAGGSSSGSAVAVVTEAVDIALSTDQAGSIRVPAAWSGCTGHKPTHGLVPYTGAVRMGYMMDHLGPIARTVEHCARALEVIAGPDGRDPTQPQMEPGQYLDTVEVAEVHDASDLTIGVVEEGFMGVEPDLDSTAKTALEEFSSVGAEIREISIPIHEDGALIWRGILPESVAALTRDDGLGHFVDGYYDTQFLRMFGNLRRARGDDFPPTYKFLLLLGEYLMEEEYGYFHAKAQNLNTDLRAAYSEALENVDVLAMPTSPVTAYSTSDIADRSDPREVVKRAQAGIRTANSSPFDVTGHPALSVPCGTSNGLPVGLMFIGEHFDDETVLSVGHIFEQAVDVEFE